MQVVLAKLNELLGILQQRIEFNNRVGKETEDRAAKLNEKEAGLLVREKSLDVLEAKLRPMGDAAAVREQAATTEKEAKDALGLLHKEKDAFNEYVSTTRTQMAVERQQLNIDKAKVEKDNVLLNKEWEALNEAKKNLRADLINEIMKSNVR